MEDEMKERCKYHVCDEDDDHDPECHDWPKTRRNLDGEDAPYPGMATAFEAHYGQSWTDPDWRKEAATWAAAWKAALSHNAELRGAKPIGEESRSTAGLARRLLRRGKKMQINTDKPYRIFAEVLEQEALNQFESAMQQPFVVRGALMPDAHAGYSLPIGSVVATDGVVLPAELGCGMLAVV